MYPGIRHQIRLKFGQIHVERSVKTQRSRDGRHNLTNQTVEIFVGRSLNVKVPSTDVIYSLVIDHECAVGMLQGGVGGQYGIVRFHYSCRYLGQRSQKYYSSKSHIFRLILYMYHGISLVAVKVHVFSSLTTP